MFGNYKNKITSKRFRLLSTNNRSRVVSAKEKLKAALTKERPQTSIEEIFRLITNNPLKIEDLTAHDVNVSGRVPIIIPPTIDNQAYLNVKRDRGRHLLPKEPNNISENIRALFWFLDHRTQSPKESNNISEITRD